MTKPTFPVHFLAVSLALAGCWARGAAAQEIGLDAGTFLGDVPVFVTVTRLPQDLSETPASVMVIDREMIEAAGVVEVADLLRLVPGFIVAHYHDTDGSRTVVSYYGFSDQYARRLQVLVDGMSVYMPATGGVEWPDLPLAVDDIERIEVVRGPNGAAYGSNSFLGVINIITRHPQDSESSASVTLGSLGHREGTVRLAGGGDTFQVRLTGGYRSSQGYSDPREGPESLPVNDDSITRTLALRADYRASVNDYWTFNAGFVGGPREVGFDDLDPFDPRRFQEIQGDHQQVSWRRMLDADRELQVQVYRNHYLKKDKFETAPLSSILSGFLGFPVTPAQVPLAMMLIGLPPTQDQRLKVDTGVESTRQNIEASYRFRLSPDWRLVAGAEYRDDEVVGENYFDQGGRFHNRGTRVFFNGEWQPSPKWTINIGDLYEQNDLLDGSHSPRLSISRRLTDTHFLRATASRAYRIPAFAEEELDFTFRFDDGQLLHRLYDSDGDIEPERIDNMELALGAEGAFYSYELKAFRNEITSLTSAPLDVSRSQLARSWRIVTGGELTIEGGEFQTTFRPTPDLLIAAGLAQAYASGWRIAEVNPEVREDIGDTVPETTVSALVSLRLDSGDQVGVTYYSVSSVRHFSGDLTEGVQTVDLNYIHRFRIGGHDAQARALLRDVTGSYFDFEQETNREFQAFLTLGIAL